MILRIIHRFANACRSGKVHHRVGIQFLESGRERARIGNVADNQASLRNRLAMPLHEIVVSDGIKTVREKMAQAGAADISRAAGDEYPIAHLLFTVKGISSRAIRREASRRSV